MEFNIKILFPTHVKDEAEETVVVLSIIATRGLRQSKSIGNYEPVNYRYAIMNYEMYLYTCKPEKILQQICRQTPHKKAKCGFRGIILFL